MARFIKISSIIFIVISSLFIVPIGKVNADSQINCSDRYATLVNPVRGRDLWSDKTLEPIIEQYSASAKYNFPATWLLQYDALIDEELINEVKSFGVIGEKGVLLEVSKGLADESGVVYASKIKWSNPGVIFLSAYSQSERRLLIDTLFSQFKKNFGYYPKSVGAWWIDSYSLNYIKQKYGLSAILIVADQKTTDSYGVWGQWWGYPYYPSKTNVLVPANGDSLNAIVIQWAQRDPILAYGETGKYSNFSLQANDYIRNGKNTEYFKNLVDLYLNCQNSVGQITIGLETGMESVPFHKEYLNQLKVISEYTNLKVVTMSDFAEGYEHINKQNPSRVIIGSWYLTPTQRENNILGDYINYARGISFRDYFIADNGSFLDRRLPVNGLNNANTPFPWLTVFSLVLGFFAFRKNRFIVWICSVLFAFASFGLMFRSTVEFSWQVFYGPVIKQLLLIQCLIIFIIFALFLIYFNNKKLKFKNKPLLMWLLPLSFGLDMIASAFRYSVIDGNRVLGFLVNRTRIVGLILNKSSLSFFNRSFSILQTLAFLKLPFDKIWQNASIYIILYPLAHVILAVILYLVLIRVPTRVRLPILIILAVLFILHLVWIMGIDPRVVLAI